MNGHPLTPGDQQIALECLRVAVSVHRAAGLSTDASSDARSIVEMAATFLTFVRTGAAPSNREGAA